MEEQSFGNMGNTVLNKIENARGLRGGLSEPMSSEDNAGHEEASPATSGQRTSTAEGQQWML